MKLVRLVTLTLNEVTPTHYLFTIEVELSNFWSGTRIETFNCFKEKKSSMSSFMDNGSHVFNEWLYLDNSINAILSTETKIYGYKK